METDQPAVPAEPQRRGRSTRRRRKIALAAVLAVLLAAGVLLPQLWDDDEPATPAQPGTPPGAAPPHVTSAFPDTVVGFYSAGFQRSDCYGSCQPGDEGYADQEETRARLAELERLGVSFVINNVTIESWHAQAPEALSAFLDDVHAHGIRVSYSVASGPEKWFDGDEFDPTEAEERFRLTDLDGDGVSDLDGKLDVLYQGHEVLEWATHEHRVQIYRIAKKWFPTTPVAVYYAAFTKPFANPDAPHRGGPGGTWDEYAYGPGEADIVHVGIRRNAVLDEADADSTQDEAVDAGRLADAAREVVRLVHERTPGIPIWVSTNFSGDDNQRENPGAMWTPEEITQWFEGLASVPEITGLFLRSYSRFTYDLAHPDFGAQRAAFAAGAAEVAAQAGR